MSKPLRLSRFAKEVTAEGVLDEMLRRLPPDEIAPALARFARDRGYDLNPSDLQFFLSGIGARGA